MKKILILLLTTTLLASCFGKDVEEAPEEIVSNVVEVSTWATTEEAPTDDIDEETPETEQEVSETVEETPVDTSTEEVQTEEPTQEAPTDTSTSDSNPEEQEIIKDFEEELDSLFDLLESDEG